ncbi:aspartic peptidase domain-containing protein [Obelidium mucronatum]|nr:aspartic peptidase domain-containing protein [Obelidium mucronatum]
MLLLPSTPTTTTTTCYLLVAATVFWTSTTMALPAVAPVPSSSGTIGETLVRVPIRKGVIHQAMNRADGTPTISSITNIGDTAYFTEIEVGTPAQKFLVQVDTGSSTMWLGSLACNELKNCNDKNGFNPALSETFKDTSNGRNRSIQYGLGKVTGTNSQDTARIGNLVIPKQEFILVSEEDETIQEENNKTTDGLIGLSWGGIYQNASKGYYPTVIDNLVSNKLISEPVFSLWLNGSGDANGDSLFSNGGELVLGGVDPNHYRGDISYYNVVDSFFWAVSLYSVSVGSGSKSALAPINPKTTAMFDSGTTLIFMETRYLLDHVLPALYAAIEQPVPASRDESSGLFEFPCARAPQLPDVNFSFGDGRRYAVSWHDYVVAVDAAACGVGLLPNGEGNNMWILGDVFLTRYVAVFDLRAGAVVPGGAVPGAVPFPRVGLAASSNAAPRFVGAALQAAARAAAAAVQNQFVADGEPRAVAAATPTTLAARRAAGNRAGAGVVVLLLGFILLF